MYIVNKILLLSPFAVHIFLMIFAYDIYELFQLGQLGKCTKSMKGKQLEKKESVGKVNGMSRKTTRIPGQDTIF